MYFHNGNNRPTTIFERNDCRFDEIYVSDLEEGGYLVSEIPYFFSSANGHMPITIQMRTFNHYDPNHELIKTVNLTFIIECEDTQNIIVEEEGRISFPYWGSALLILLVSILLTYIYKRRGTYAKNRLYR
jgi:hypothetical protein